MRSMRKYLACVGSDQGSVLHDFFGLGQASETLSVQQQMERLRRPHVLHLNFVRIGFDLLTPNERKAAERELDLTAHRCRQIYDQAALGIGRILHFELLAADADGFADIADDGEAEDLSDRFSIDNDGIDIAFVLTYAGSVGSSPKPPGSCDKSDKGAGIVVDIEESNEWTATAMAHEVGHYLGLDHRLDDETNLMSYSGQRGLTADQTICVRGHCFVTECPEVQET